jgi:SWI/SNF-related matrix-associated actin-dependent regulator 1 of chromatin subfamily A
MNHPVASKYNLRTYSSKYAGQRCCISGESLAVGEPIANIVPILAALQDLSLVKTKTFKYAALRALPCLASEEETILIRAAAEYLVGSTDPEWPLDGIGCSVSSYWPCQNWLASGCHELGTQAAAKALRQHVGTQIDEGSAQAKAILAVATRRWTPGTNNSAGTSTQTTAPKAAKEAPEAPTTATASVGGHDVTVGTDRRPGEILLAASGHGLKVYLDAPWVTPAHGMIKDAMKAKGATWDPTAKCWRLGISTLLVHLDLFTGQAVVVTAEAKALLDAANTCTAQSDATDATDDVKARIDAVLPEGKKLYPFQYSGTNFIDLAGGRALIADDMGTGKTIQTAAYLALHPEMRPAVLVVPAVVTANWRRECNSWLPADRVQVLKTGKDAIDADATIYVVTYDLLRKHVEALQARKPAVVVGDEIHLCKNYKAQRTEAFVVLAKTASVKAMIGLSGTPIVNRPIEFYTFLNLLRPSDFGSWRKFTARYCDGHMERVSRSKEVYIAKGATNLNELNTRLRSFMIRRTKEQVLTELPAKTRQITPVEMTAAERKIYKSATNGAEIKLAEITALRQAVGQIKVRAALDWIESYTETDTPLLVFAHHHDVLDALEAGCKKLGARYGRIDGGVSQTARGALVDNFQAGKLDIMLLSSKAAGVGVTLTRASDVLFVEFQWTPGEMTQCEDRCYRIGQTKPVTIRNLVVEGTIDEDMVELLASKQQVLEAVLDGAAPTESLDIRAELIARYGARLTKSN